MTVSLKVSRQHLCHNALIEKNQDDGVQTAVRYYSLSHYSAYNCNVDLCNIYVIM